MFNLEIDSKLRAAWRMNGRFAPKAALGRLEIQLPLYPRKQTQLGNRGMSEKCQEQTSANSIFLIFEQKTNRWGWMVGVRRCCYCRSRTLCRCIAQRFVFNRAKCARQLRSSTPGAEARLAPQERPSSLRHLMPFRKTKILDLYFVALSSN